MNAPNMCRNAAGGGGELSPGAVVGIIFASLAAAALIVLICVSIARYHPHSSHWSPPTAAAAVHTTPFIPTITRALPIIPPVEEGREVSSADWALECWVRPTFPLTWLTTPSASQMLGSHHYHGYAGGYHGGYGGGGFHAPVATGFHVPNPHLDSETNFFSSGCKRKWLQGVTTYCNLINPELHI